MRCVDAARLDYYIIFVDAQRSEDATCDLRLGAGVGVNLSAAQQDRNVQSPLQSNRRQHSRCRARAKRSDSVNVGHVGKRAASEHYDHVGVELVDIQRRSIGAFERAHYFFRDKARAQQIKHESQSREHRRQFGIVFDFETVGGDGEEGDYKNARRQNPTCAEL